MPDELVNVRYMVDDVESAVASYTNHFGFTVLSSAAPAFADVVRGRLRLLLRGPARCARRPRQLRRATDARRAHTRAGGLEPHSPDRRRHRRRGRAAASRRPDIP